jgi:cytidylate kinase
MSARRIIVAIDGPAGAGKSTVTRRVATALGYFVLDTGALYRCVALAAMRAGVDLGDDAAVSRIAADLAARRAIRFVTDVKQERAGQRVMLEDEDVSKAIRTQATSDGASRVSALPGVRAALLELQRGIGMGGGAVVEGRDIATVVFPDAAAKFYLTASPEERARRRYAELLERGERADYDEILREVKQRDERDMNRSVAPLVQAPDAEVVDSSAMSIDEVVETIVASVLDVTGPDSTLE